MEGNNPFAWDLTNSTNQNCFKFSREQVEAVIIAKTTGVSAGAIACIIAITIIIALKEYHKFVYRLMLYLLLATLVVAVCMALDVAPVYYDGKHAALHHGLEGFCVAIAFVVQCALWTEHLIVCWIVVYIILLAVFDYSAKKRKHEILGIIVSVFLPFTFNWIPFLKGMYGLSTLWCWIKLTKDDCHSNYNWGVALQFALLYGPLAVIILFSFTSFVVIVATFCKRRASQGSLLVHQQAFKQSLQLLVYPVIYNIVWTLMFANRVYYAVSVQKGEKPYYPLWIITTIGDPIRVLIVPLAFILHPTTLKKIFCRTDTDKDTQTTYPVSPENSYSEEDPLIISSSESLNITRYQSVFS